MDERKIPCAETQSTNTEPTSGAISRRTFLGAVGATAVAGTGLANSALSTPSAVAAPYFSKKPAGTITVAFTGTSISPGEQSVAKNFEKLYSGANVKFVPVEGTDWDQYFAKILTMMAAGTIPDVMDVATEGMQLFAGKGLSHPLDDYVKRDAAQMKAYFANVHPVLVEAMMFQGHLYELPSDFNAANMFLNTTLLHQAGESYPSASWTKDDFYNLASRIKSKVKGQVFAYDWVNRLWGGWMPWIYVNGSNLLAEGRASGGSWLWNTFYKGKSQAMHSRGGWNWGPPQANHPANVEALAFMVELAKQHLTPTISAGGGGLLQGFFTANKLGMTPAGGFWAGGLNQAGMKPNAFDVQYFPRWKSQRHQFGTAGLVIMNRSKNKDLAWEYVKYRTSKSVLHTILSNNSSTPVLRSLMTATEYAPTGPKHWQVLYNTLDKLPSGPIPAPTWYQTMNTIFLKYTDLAMTFQQSPKTALDNMQRDLEAAYKKR